MTHEGGVLATTGPGVPGDFEPAGFTELVDDPSLERDDAYLRMLLWLLVSAAFFEGYDGSILLRNGTTNAGDGTLSMVEDPIRGWQVVALAPPVAGATVPSRGGSRVSKAPVVLYAVALAIGAAVATGCAALVRAAGPPTEARPRSGAAAPLRSP